jgi:hypothetical protein
MSLTTKIILALIVLHLLLGFGWLLYKLSPRKEDQKDDPKAGTSED